MKSFPKNKKNLPLYIKFKRLNFIKLFKGFDHINNIMDTNFCNTCMKNYASYQSLWNHNKKFHQDKQINNPIKSINNPIKSINNPIKSINKNDFDKLQCKNKKSRFFIFRFLKKY